MVRRVRPAATPVRRAGHEPRLAPRDLPVDVLLARLATGDSVSKLARHYGCDRRTIAVAVGRYPPCSTPGCPRFSRRTQPDLCRECARS